MNELSGIVNRFNTDSSIISINPYGSGHINDSYLVRTSPERSPDYLLQRINHFVFNNIQQLTENILKVTSHINKRLEPGNKWYGQFRIYSLIGSRDGTYTIQDQAGSYWRLLSFINGSKSYDLVTSPEIAFEAGKAYGIFQDLTADLDARTIVEVLPRFHDIILRLENFRISVMKNAAGRVNEARSEIAFAEEMAGEMHRILFLGKDRKIPLRVTHNDTKINNVLFDEMNQAISVVDLDTVMPGYLLYDFGDAIRTGACTSSEDEADLQKVGIDLKLFEAYASGYMEVASRFLTRVEIENLAFSAKFMTYIIGLRFLTDHLNGDLYYKTAFPGHNLQRARAQFRLLQSMEAHYEEMKTIVTGTM
jgi:Ser/Thr protein kinase RdoA (MazF antagonist)